MSSRDTPVARLAFSKKIAAALIRRLPVSIRRVRVWRDEAYRLIGGGGWEENDSVDACWPSEIQEPTRGRASGMKMSLNLSDWAERRAFFTGRYYQEDLEELLSKLLAPGDSFVDVGANIGLVSLHAARIIAPTGELWAFEPNPDTFARLSRHFEMNGLDAARAMNCGLGAAASSLTMTIYGRHSGKATLVERNAPSLKTVSVKVLRGDDALAEVDVTKPTVIKIDVEGFEVAVLQGLEKVLDGNVAVVVEVSRSWLEMAGTSVQSLYQILKDHGLEPHEFCLREGRIGRRLIVRRLPGPLQSEQYDCLFMKSDSVFLRRLSSCLETR